ncbi:glycosyl transferase [Pararhizobium haloflavum]|uniref:glycosyl transferase n=1 Tax=Pararhizobium haloflavum TaxID=2037914 RepID=UPI000C1A084A|nr:glycosyl transferase [Pararhizobium haloflavum]
MISVLIEARGPAEPLALTLAGLVSGAVEGLVGDVVILSGGEDGAIAELADAAGCRLAPLADLRAAIESARCDWLLMLEPGARLLPGWIEGAGEHIAHAGGPARFRHARSERGSILSRFQERRSPLAFGLLAPKRDVLALDPRPGGLRDIARALKGTRLDCAIMPAGRPRA